MRILKLKIDAELSNQLERLMFEINFKQDIIQRLMESHAQEDTYVDSPLFKRYEKECFDLQLEYNFLLKEMDKVIFSAYPQLEGHQVSWENPFNEDNEIIIKVLCDCEIEGI